MRAIPPRSSAQYQPMYPRIDVTTARKSTAPHAFGPASGMPSLATSPIVSGATTIVPRRTPQSVVALLERPRGGSIAPATYPSETHSAAASTSRSPASVACDEVDPRPAISTTSPTSATPLPSTQARLGARRKTSAAYAPVKTGSAARIITPCSAEVRCCPTV